MSLQRSKFHDKVTPPQRRKIWINCALGGKQEVRSKHADTSKQRIKVAQRNECPFSITAKFDRKMDYWELDETKDPRHNHDPFEEVSFYQHRGFTDIEIDTVSWMSRAGCVSGDILLVLRVDQPDSTINARDVYNLRARMLTGDTGEYSRMQKFMLAVKKKEDSSTVYKKDEDTFKL